MLAALPCGWVCEIGGWEVGGCWCFAVLLRRGREGVYLMVRFCGTTEKIPNATDAHFNTTVELRLPTGCPQLPLLFIRIWDDNVTKDDEAIARASLQLPTARRGTVERFSLKGRAKGNDVQISFTYEIVNVGDTPAEFADTAPSEDVLGDTPDDDATAHIPGDDDDGASSELTESIGRVMSNYLSQFKEQVIAEHEQREALIRERIRKLELKAN